MQSHGLITGAAGSQGSGNPADTGKKISGLLNKKKHPIKMLSDYRLYKLS